ncbi:MAG: hypothetical protein RDU14_06015 [Melioribacteraceae bacterium]|nr:hypothetical protein [Melioribacteraceae bacterium]
MKITRLYTGADNETHFDTIDYKLFDNGEIGRLSKKVKVKELIFRETDGDFNYDFHPAPQKQFIALLDGEIEIENGFGEKRRFKAGDVLLVEDVSGRGHKTKSIDGKLRRSIFITLDE